MSNVNSISEEQLQVLLTAWYMDERTGVRPVSMSYEEWQQLYNITLQMAADLGDIATKKFVVDHTNPNLEHVAKRSVHDLLIELSRQHRAIWEDTARFFHKLYNLMYE